MYVYINIYTYNLAEIVPTNQKSHHHHHHHHHHHKSAGILTERWSSKEWSSHWHSRNFLIPRSSHLDGVDLPIVAQISSAPSDPKCVYTVFFRLHSQAPSWYYLETTKQTTNGMKPAYSFICCNLICSFKLWNGIWFKTVHFWRHWGGHGRVVPKAIVAWCWC